MRIRARTLLALLAVIVPLAAAPVAHGQVPPSLSLDTFFAPPSGIADGDFSPTNIIPDIPAAVAVHGDRIYTVGRTGSSSSQDIGIIARHADGSLDMDFSGDGKLEIPIAPSPAAPPVPASNEEDDGRGIAVLSDGRIRVLGTTDAISGSASLDRDVVVVGLMPDGTPDTTFGTADVRGNRRVTLANPGNDLAGRIVVGPDDRLAIAGGRSVGARLDLFVALLEAGGAPVTGFGAGGLKVVNQGGGTVNDTGIDVVFRPGGGLVALVSVESSPLSSVLHAFTDDGQPDPSFSDDGDLPLDFGGTDTAGGLIEHGGRLYASGSTQVGSDTDAFIARVEADGSGLQRRLFDMRGRFVGIDQAAISHSTDLVVVPGTPATLVAVGLVQYTTELGTTSTDWAAAALDGFEGDLALARYADLVVAAPGEGGLFSVAAGPDRWLAVTGKHFASSDDGFGNARLLLDVGRACDLGVSVAEPAEIVFRGLLPASLTTRVTNFGTRACAGTLNAPAPYRMTPVQTGAIAPGATFNADAVPIAYEGVRRAEDILAVSLAAPEDANPDNNLAAAHVAFSFCDLALQPIGRAGAIPTEGRRRFPVNLRNGGTTSCRVRIGSKRPYSLASGQSASDRVAVAAPRGAEPGTRVAVVLRAGATDDVNASDNAATVSPSVVKVGTRTCAGAARAASRAARARAAAHRRPSGSGPPACTSRCCARAPRAARGSARRAAGSRRAGRAPGGRARRGAGCARRARPIGACGSPRRCRRAATCSSRAPRSGPDSPRRASRQETGTGSNSGSPEPGSQSFAGRTNKIVPGDGSSDIRPHGCGCRPPDARHRRLRRRRARSGSRARRRVRQERGGGDAARAA